MYRTASVLALVLSLLFFGGCQTPPQPTTQQERDSYTLAVSTARAALVVAAQRGAIPAAKLELANSQLTRIQKRIDDSGTTPITWQIVYGDLLAFTVEWALPPPSQDAPVVPTK